MRLVPRRFGARTIRCEQTSATGVISPGERKRWESPPSDNATYRELRLSSGLDTFLAEIRQFIAGGIPHDWHLRGGE